MVNSTGEVHFIPTKRNVFLAESVGLFVLMFKTAQPKLMSKQMYE